MGCGRARSPDADARGNARLEIGVINRDRELRHYFAHHRLAADDPVAVIAALGFDDGPLRATEFEKILHVVTQPSANMKFARFLLNDGEKAVLRAEPHVSETTHHAEWPASLTAPDVREDPGIRAP